MANTITQTTVSGSFNQGASIFTVASATNLTAPVSNFRQAIYVINPGQTKGELMDVVGLSGTQVSVARSSLFRQSFYTGSIVVIAPAPNAAANFGGNFNGSFFETDPVGDPSVAGSYPGAPVVTPWLNATNGLQWLQDVNGVWQPGWNNPGSVSGPTTVVASVAGPHPHRAVVPRHWRSRHHRDYYPGWLRWRFVLNHPRWQLHLDDRRWLHRTCGYCGYLSRVDVHLRHQRGKVVS